MIGHAIRDAAKLFTLELQIEAGRQFAELPDEITISVMRSPEDAKELLNEIVAKRTPDANCGSLRITCRYPLKLNPAG
jgi:hypothetical protein